MNKHSKILLTILVLLIIGINHLGFVDRLGRSYTEDGFKRALVTYAVVRGLNSVISVAQGTEIAIEPVGIGLTFTPGQILDPINDLIERFSWIVLASGTSLGIQKVLLQMSEWSWFSITVSFILAIAVILIWFENSDFAQLKNGFLRLSLIMLILRFSVPVAILANQTIYDHFLEPRYLVSSQQLKQTSNELRDLNEESQAEIDITEEQGLNLFENAKRVYNSAVNSANITERIKAFKQAAEHISEHTINLIVIFVFQTLLIPLLFLWLVVQLIKWVIRTDNLSTK